MRLILSLALLAGLSNLAAAAEAKYALTGDNTKIEWTGTKPGGKHDGGFKKLTGSATAGDSIAFKVEIDCDSLFSDDDKLTGHLKSPDFFGVKDNPKASFESTKVVKGDKGYTVTGNLTLCGKKKEISFPAEISTTGGLTVKADFKINRTDFGMTYGKGKMDDDVAIRVKLEAK